MISQEDFLTNLVKKLDRYGIPYMLAGSEQQFRDALGVAIVQYDRLDVNYLHKWARQLGVDIVLNQLLEQAKKQINSQ